MSRIPPAGEDLEFIENTGTGTVHILPWDDTPPEKISEGKLAESLVAVLTGPAPPMLGGKRLRHIWPGAPGQPVSEFPDENLCRACVHALGDQSVRAFEHPQPGGNTHEPSGEPATAGPTETRCAPRVRS